MHPHTPLPHLPLDLPTHGHISHVHHSLNSDQLKLGLLKKAQEDPVYRPFFALVSAAEDPDVDSQAQVEKALRQIQAMNVQEAEDHGEVLAKEDLVDVCPFQVQVDTKTMVMIDDVDQVVTPTIFQNWGKTVSFTPSYTLVPRTVKALCEVVKWAKKESKKIRVGGFRHSWSEVFGNDGDVLIMFLPVETLTALPYKQPPDSWRSDLSGIQIVDTVAGRSPPENHAFCKVMAGTTNGQFHRWCLDNKTWTLPFNVIMLEVTFGGTNAPICHGSGLSSTTLSDLVAEVSYVDAHGNVQTINDSQELRLASGSFGLLGVVTSVTLLLDRMSMAVMMPVKLPVVLAVPPPKGYPIPKEIQDMITKARITDTQIEQARKEFIKRCQEHYYLEWFWFPYQEQTWVNTWHTRPLTSQDRHAQEYPGKNWFAGEKSQELQESLAECITNSRLWKKFSGRFQAVTLGAATMLALPHITKPKDAIQAFLIDGLHFRRGIQNFRCWDTEWEIPLSSRGKERDYEAIQRAWWDGISAIYTRPDAPVRLALEMRLTGGSNVTLAPQRGNTYGTVSIEVLTTLTTPKEDWQSFCQVVADKWTAYEDTDEAGDRLLPRPHWAKEWHGLNIRGKPIETYMKEDAYKDAFKEFKEGFEKIVTARGSTVEESLRSFGNDTMERLIFK